MFHAPSHHGYFDSSKEIMVLTSVVTIVAAASMWMNTFPLQQHSENVVPFTAEEWRWAIRDGYFPTMVAHYMRHGGL